MLLTNSEGFPFFQIDFGPFSTGMRGNNSEKRSREGRRGGTSGQALRPAKDQANGKAQQC